ncbi:MAG TPA: hypothetical protein EYP25_11250, partial [Anaerolineae bacterium]|nr:hypothetical protein [Anaerolineae bacterium]
MPVQLMRRAERSEGGLRSAARRLPLRESGATVAERKAAGRGARCTGVIQSKTLVELFSRSGDMWCYPGKRRLACPLGVVLFCLVSGTAWAAQRAARPNVVLLVLDNIGYGDLGCYGNRFIMTPHMNRLAAEGVRCTDFYIASPSCMPSRGAFLTGRHPVRNGLNQQLIDDLKQIGLSQEELIIPRCLKQAGYVSGCFGKWNIGFRAGSRPTERGFDEYFGNASGNCDYYTHIYRGRNDLFRNTEPADVEGYTTFLYADAACDFIRRSRGKPFFCYTYLLRNLYLPYLVPLEISQLSL